MMRGTPATMLSEVTQQEGGPAEIMHTRFGEVMVDVSKAVHFPKGLLGMPDRMHFILANFPSEKMQQFKLLQSLDEIALSFITLPLDLANPIIEEADALGACADLDILPENLAMLLIVSVHRTPEAVRISANARAPVLIDATRKSGAQYVFQHDKYKVQHLISG